jgi:hypothetical protein
VFSWFCNQSLTPSPSPFKGRTLKKLLDESPFLHDSIESVVPQRYQLELDDLPQPEDELACSLYEAKLCRDFIIQKFSEAGTHRDERQAGGSGAVNAEGDGVDEESPEVDEIDELIAEVENIIERDNSELVRILTLHTLCKNILIIV